MDKIRNLLLTVIVIFLLSQNVLAAFDQPKIDVNPRELHVKIPTEGESTVLFTMTITNPNERTIYIGRSGGVGYKVVFDNFPEYIKRQDLVITDRIGIINELKKGQTRKGTLTFNITPNAKPGSYKKNIFLWYFYTDVYGTHDELAVAGSITIVLDPPISTTIQEPKEEKKDPDQKPKTIAIQKPKKGEKDNSGSFMIDINSKWDFTIDKLDIEWTHTPSGDGKHNGVSNSNPYVKNPTVKKGQIRTEKLEFFVNSDAAAGIYVIKIKIVYTHTYPDNQKFSGEIIVDPIIHVTENPEDVENPHPPSKPPIICTEHHQKSGVDLIWKDYQKSGYKLLREDPSGKCNMCHENMLMSGSSFNIFGFVTLTISLLIVSFLILRRKII